MTEFKYQCARESSHPFCFAGTLPSVLEDLVFLEHINLSGQKSVGRFTGQLLPFASNQFLHQFNMSWNAFTGPVPVDILKAVDKNTDTLLDLSNNKLSGKIPVELGAFQRLNIDLAANKIDQLPSTLCGHPEWMHGIVGLVAAAQKCDAILCKPGTFTTMGRQLSKGTTCQKCASLDEAPYYGSTACFDHVAQYEREGTPDQG